MASKQRARRPLKPSQRPAPNTSPIAAAGLEQIVGEMGRLNSAQSDQLEFLRQFHAPGPVGAQIRTMARQMRQGIEGWVAYQKMFAQHAQKFRETTRRTRAIGPDGRPAVLDRPVDHRRITDTIRRDMLRCPPIVMAMAARISPVVGSFSSWAPECSDPIQRALIKAQLEGPLHQLVSDALKHSLSYGFAPFELVWENNVDVELEVVEGDDEDLVFNNPVAMAKGDEPPNKPTKTATGGADGSSDDDEPIVPQMPKIKKRSIVFPGATVLTKAKDLNPCRTEILVQGRLQEFAGLRYEADKEQELDPLQSFVVTHDGPFGQMYGNAALDNVYGPFYMVEVVTQLCNMYLERKGDPPYKGHAPLVASHDENGNIIHGYTVMVDGINALRGSGGFVMPSDTDEHGKRKYDLVTMDEDPRVDIFVRWIEHMIRMMLWGMLVPDGAVWQSSRVGSFAASQTYADLAVNLREIDLRGIESYINRYIVQRVLLMNFASPKRAVIQAKTRPDVKVAMLEKVLLKALDVKTAPGQLLAQMIDWPNLLKQAGFPTM